VTRNFPRWTATAAAFAIFACFLAIIGMRSGPYTLSVVSISLLWLMLAIGLNLTMGYAGMANIGIGLFYGIGAYSAGLIATKTSLGIIAAIAFGTLISGVLAAMLAPLVLRARGLQFAIATLALGIVATDLFTNLSGITGGAVGLAGIERPAEVADPRSFYVFLALSAGIMVVLSHVFYRSRVALVLRGTRDDEQLIRSLGYKTGSYKYVGFIAGSALAGCAGVFYAYYIQYLSPAAFSLSGASFQVFVIVAFGGQGTVWGPVAGSFLLTAVPSYVNLGPQAKEVAYGVALLIVIVIAPYGIVPSLRRSIDKATAADSVNGRWSHLMKVIESVRK
jgi:branched-chain amino acid transport system permease protein